MEYRSPALAAMQPAMLSRRLPARRAQACARPLPASCTAHAPRLTPFPSKAWPFQAHG
ncbi:hypothetical protein L490_2286 [Bordetella bronchiseptica 00-P-2796]|uniref:Uncharacterized protein n=1 Tax=Bordetella bronchiseptica 00-P-2796 TaxID=1331199 RepID=A0ABR4RET9_BORBO|nr:hypothetical protein L490_2286 [Bordetella bronchiseptica 00-P-2796]KDC13089.1 hypothetical protein AZ24_2413 [Bordetella bronchiseptica E013]